MKFLSLFAIVIITSSCSSHKIDVTLDKFAGDRQPYAQSWTGGIPGSGSGVNVFLPLSKNSIENIETVYFKGMTTSVIDSKDGLENYVIARFKTSFNQRPDINVSLDSKEEYGNKPPKIEKFPFELEDDEAVIKFDRDGKYTYTKIKGIKTKSEQYLPSQPQ